MGLESLKGRRALVTGGAGTIGSHIVDQLVGAGAAHITVLDNLAAGRRDHLPDDDVVQFVQGDIRNRDLVARLTREVDVVFHQAGPPSSRCAEDPRLAVQVMVDGTCNVLEGAVAGRVKKVVAASAGSFYGAAEPWPATEGPPASGSETIYETAMVLTEGLLHSFHRMYGLDCVALRYFDVYGPRMKAHGAGADVLASWIERISAGRPPVIKGTGVQTMDFVFTDDVARANLLAAESDVTDEVLDVASGVETSLLELAQRLLRAMNSDLYIEFGPSRVPGKVVRRLPDPSAAHARLGFRAEIGLDRGLRRLVEWWRAERSTASPALAATG